NVKFTAEMEDSLDKVEYGKVEWHDLLQGYYQEMTRLIRDLDMQKAKQENMETTDIKCDKCGSPMIIKWGKRGQFLACSSFPKCKNIKNFEKDDQGNIRILETEKLAEKCPKCGGELVIKNGRFGKFIACSNFPKCKFTKPVSLDIKCPACEIGDIVEKRSKKGKTFYSCSRYPDCKFLSNTLPEKIECPHCGHVFYRSSDKQDELNLCPHCRGEID
ncbi:MAG: topoisomerase DNA-binding C4 zinc finger domain-containing protein, partial [Candidatus Cloacimonetes bacterium]|nr:topoisomerase DNA-binding C4 zinc finger domain-containing protein [Candidatus Cloacimonadota bacterium]